MSFTVTLTWDDGSPQAVDLHDYNGENLILSAGFRKTVTLYKNFAPVQDRATMTILWRTSLASQLISIDPDIMVTVNIQRDGAAWFYGYLRPVTKWVDTGNAASSIDLEVLDNSWRLKRAIRSTLDAQDYTVSEIIAAFLDDAGYSESEYDATGITTNVGYYLEPGVGDGEEDARTYWGVISEILFSHHHIFYFDETGVFRLYDWSAQTIPAISGFINDNNIVDNLEAERKIPEYDGVNVDFRTIDDNQDFVVNERRVTLPLRYSETSRAFADDDKFDPYDLGGG